MSRLVDEKTRNNDDDDEEKEDDDDEASDSESEDVGTEGAYYVRRRFISHIDRQALHLRRLVDESQDRLYMYLPKIWHRGLAVALWVCLGAIIFPSFALFKSTALVAFLEIGFTNHMYPI